MSDSDVVVKWFTRARKFPQLIGRTPDGTKLWGGPYTITQVLVAGGLLFLGWQTTALWARFGFLGNVILAAIVLVGVVVPVGKLPHAGRSPLSVVAGCCRALVGPAAGRSRGVTVTVRRPHRVRHQVAVAYPSANHPVAADPLAPVGALSGARLTLAGKAHR